jgi:hypothetical protein
VPSTDDPDHLATFGEHNGQQSSGAEVPEHDEPLLSFRVPRIFRDTTQWIAEDRGGLSERYPMLGAIACGFAPVPSEDHRRAAIRLERLTHGR